MNIIDLYDYRKIASKMMKLRLEQLKMEQEHVQERIQLITVQLKEKDVVMQQSRLFSLYDLKRKLLKLQYDEVALPFTFQEMEHEFIKNALAAGNLITVFDKPRSGQTELIPKPNLDQKFRSDDNARMAEETDERDCGDK